jgi:thiol:disulfide interchange protein DsbC
MKLVKVAMMAALSLGTVFAASFAFSETSKEATIKKALEPRLGENAKIDSVTKTPYSGLYEVRTNGEIIYTDENAKYLFVGRVLDLSNNFKDMTAARVDEINKIKFSDLPLDSAVKMVKGDGKRVIAVFEDPNCGYCKKFRHTLHDMDNITVYTFMYNILAPDSATKSKNIWCSSDRSKAWDEWMLNGKLAPDAPANCTAPNDKVLALGQKLRISGTPMIFFMDGTRVPGAIDAKALESKLASIK